MCGIAGYVGAREAVPVILEGLQRLEYRGYDSAGLCTVGDEGILLHKVVGRVADLVNALPEINDATTGIGHTRWATHGEPNVANAHPHLDADGRFAVVHNGIIENAAELRRDLEADGVSFASATDTEVLVQLMAAAGTDDVEEALDFALSLARGTYGIAAVGAASPGTIVLARNGSPVVVGAGDHEHFVASDVAAFARFTQRAIYLEDHEVAVVTADGITSHGLTPARPRRVASVVVEAVDYDCDGYAHFMEKEIHEQPAALRRLLGERLDVPHGTVELGDLGIGRTEARSLRRVTLIGCGSAYYAGLAGAQIIERVARIPAQAAPASEFRYSSPLIDPDSLYVALSQSGETHDTLQAVAEITRQGGRAIALVNVPESSLARLCEHHLYLRSGPEISVTSTKTFESTLLALTLLAIDLAEKRGRERSVLAPILAALDELPNQLEGILGCSAEIGRIAERFAEAKSAFYVGRISGYPIALEGSQKLKEVSYIHAEAYPCGELKHGPIALVAPELPTVAVVPDDELMAKNRATLEEIRARKGPIVAIGHSDELKSVCDELVVVPKRHPVVDPLLLLVPLQLLAYRTAVLLGVDVDKPRNLAKSVTVE